MKYKKIEYNFQPGAGWGFEDDDGILQVYDTLADLKKGINTMLLRRLLRTNPGCSRCEYGKFACDC